MVTNTRTCAVGVGSHTREHRRRLVGVDLDVRPLRALVEENRPAIRALARHHRARSIALFGSVARGDETADSDIDFVAEFDPGSSLFDLLHLQDALAELLGRPVDVVSAGGLKARDAHIRREAVRL